MNWLRLVLVIVIAFFVSVNGFSRNYMEGIGWIVAFVVGYIVMEVILMRRRG